MATTYIQGIKTTPELSIHYDMVDKIKVIEKDGKMKDVLCKTINTAINCNVKSVAKDFEKMRIAFDKDKLKNKHFVIRQSFDENVSSELAHQIGVEFAKRYLPNYQCVVSTHTNTDHAHNHIAFNVVSIDGKVYYDGNKTYRALRQMSDKICQEFGLGILEKTKDYKLVKFKSSNGKYKFFEPCDGKERDGQYRNNDYRDTNAYKESEKNKKINYITIKNDIDDLLPFVKTYEELLLRLKKEKGYTIKDKTSKGEYRKYVSFKAPNQDKFTRDNSLEKINGEKTGTYLRENLIKRIAELQEHQKDRKIIVDEEKESINDRLMTPAYSISDIDTIDEEKRTDNVLRGQVEKIIITDTKEMNRELNDEFVNVVKSKTIPKQYLDRRKYLLQQIKNNLNTLHFVEEKNIQSFAQLNKMVFELCQQRNKVYKQLAEIKKVLKAANTTVVTIKNYNNLKNRSDLSKSEQDLIRTYETILKEKDLLGEAQQNYFANQYTNFYKSFKNIANQFEIVSKSISDYNEVVNNLNRIDKKYNNEYQEEIQEYYSIAKDYTIHDDTEDVSHG